MNSTQIKCFHSLGKTHNFTQTAKELYLAQPTVSKNIHNLEKEIGIQLIFHDHRKICLTEEGKYFHEVLLKVAADIDNALQKIKKSEISKQRTISLGYSGLPFEKQFLPVFIQLMQQKRKWSVELKTISLSKSDFKNMLDNQQIDFMIYQSDFFNDDKYHFYPMMRAGFSVIIRRDSPLQKYAKVPLQELNKKIYLWDSRIPLQSVAQLKRAIENVHTAPKIEIIHKVSVATMLVQANDGIAIVPSFAYDRSNNEVYYRFLDWDHFTAYGLGCLQETQKDPSYQDVIVNMQKAINFTKEKWNG